MKRSPLLGKSGVTNRCTPLLIQNVVFSGWASILVWMFVPGLM
jgi:hypothetical protein